MTTMAPTEHAVGHATSIANSYLSTGQHSICTCGWIGPYRLSLTEAMTDADDHQAKTA